MTDPTPAPGERAVPESGETPSVVVRDKRRIDASGAVRESAPAAESHLTPDDLAAEGFVEVRRMQAELDERTADLQRVKAEFDNYRKRVERDRIAMGEAAAAGLLAQLLPVLDDVDRAREHGELEGGFKSVADGLEATLGKLGLERTGEPGEPFDPARHEAVTHAISAGVDGPTCVAILRPGYLLGDRLIRPAMVAVAEPPPAETLTDPAVETD